MSTIHLWCPRCGKGAGLLYVAKIAKPKKCRCRNCHDLYQVHAERKEDGKIEVTWNLLFTKFPIPKELMP